MIQVNAPAIKAISMIDGAITLLRLLPSIPLLYVLHVVIPVPVTPWPIRRSTHGLRGVTAEV